MKLLCLVKRAKYEIVTDVRLGISVLCPLQSGEESASCTTECAFYNTKLAISPSGVVVMGCFCKEHLIGQITNASFLEETTK